MSKVLVFSMILSVATALAEPASRKYEGDWYISDTTDNNTGEREVYAFRMYFEKDDANFAKLIMRCSKRKPTLFVEWEDLNFPDQTVLTIGPAVNADAEPKEESYVFTKSEDVIERGLRASSDTSAKIVSALGQAKYAAITAHLASGTRTIGMKVDGTQRAWGRVSRHCPVEIMPLPPL